MKRMRGGVHEKRKPFYDAAAPKGRGEDIYYTLQKGRKKKGGAKKPFTNYPKRIIKKRRPLEDRDDARRRGS